MYALWLTRLNIGERSWYYPDRRIVKSACTSSCDREGNETTNQRFISPPLTGAWPNEQQSRVPQVEDYFYRTARQTENPPPPRLVEPAQANRNPAGGCLMFSPPHLFHRASKIRNWRNR